MSMRSVDSVPLKLVVVVVKQREHSSPLDRGVDLEIHCFGCYFLDPSKYFVSSPLFFLDYICLVTEDIN